MTEQATPRGAAPRPIPDLGFFSGPPSRSTSTFGGAPVAAPPAGPAAGNRFDGAAGNQFGSAPPAPFGTVPPPAYEGVSLDRKPRSRAGFSGLPGGRIVGAVVVVLVLGFFGYGRLDMLAGFLAGDLEIPPTLGGLQRATQPEAIAEDANTVSRLERENTGDAMAASYTDGATFYSLTAQRVRVDVDREFKDAGVAGQTQHVGESTCVVGNGVTACLRTSRSLTVLVNTSGATQQAAAAVDEAWDKV